MEEEVSSKALNPTRFVDLRRPETKSGDAKGDEVRGTMGTASSSEENVRSWFHNLSKEDKAIAVSITDRKFIGMCMNEMGCFDGQIENAQIADMDIMKHLEVRDLDTIYTGAEPSRSRASLETKMVSDAKVVNGSSCNSSNSSRDESERDSCIAHTSEGEDEVIASECSEAASSPMTNGDDSKPARASTDRSAPATATSNTTSSTSIGIETLRLKDVDATVPAKDIVSDAYRIQDSFSEPEQQRAPVNPVTIASTCEDKEDADGPDSIRTTLHFKSGLSLRIPTRSESDKKVAQNAAMGKKADSTKAMSASSSAPTRTFTEKSSAFASLPTSTYAPTSEQANEVHQHVSFGALKAAAPSQTTPTPTQSKDCEVKRMNAQRITNAKKSAARAMTASLTSTSPSPSAPTMRLMKNLRFLFQSSSGFHCNEPKIQKASQGNSQSVEEESIALTIDPSYLSEKSGMQFINDVESIVEAEFRKIKGSHGTGNVTKCKYLRDDFLIRDNNSGWKDEKLPQWLRLFLRDSKSEIPLVLVLLAQIEYSIILSCRKQTQKRGKQNNSLSTDSSPATRHESKDDSKEASIEHKSSPNAYPEPNLESTKGAGATDAPLDVPQCLKPLSSNLEYSFISGILDAYKRLQSRNRIAKPLKIPSFPMLTLCTQDFLLVPLDQAMTVMPLDAKTKNTTHENLIRFTSKWNNIIDVAQKIVDSTNSRKKQEAAECTSDNEVVKLFQDEVLTKKNPKKKKKNKKKKKKKKASNAVSSNKNEKKSDCEKKFEILKEEITDPANDVDIKTPKPADASSLTNAPNIPDASEQKEKDVSNTVETDVKEVEELEPSISSITPKDADVINTNDASSKVNIEHQDTNDDGWETVEPKGGRGKKATTNSKSNNEKMGQTATRKNKGKSKSRNRNRQKEKEQAKANLDSHEIDIAKRGANTTKALMEERTKRQAALVQKKKSDGSVTEIKSLKRPSTLKLAAVGGLASKTNRFKSEETLKIGTVSNKQKYAELRNNTESIQTKKSLSADQNTASTVQETISAASRSFAFTEEAGKRLEAKVAQRKSLNEAVTGATETRENSSGSSTVDDARTNVRKSLAPPLQTLVGPGNFNSANSSVASSLDAPRATRHGSNKHNSSKEDDVGYHLLKVCERLSGDMNTFMARRALALTTRRQERGALLASLQEIVQSIWADQCRVEMYGSCATQLDLPSSDLDVVVCGLDRTENQKSRTQSFNDETSESGSHSPSSLSNEAQAYANQFYPPLSKNGTRVLRLATELEQFPWVVQVKAIPTASVPVIKILADPSRLPGAAGMDWMLHQQQMAAAAVAAAEMNLGKMMAPQQPVESSDQTSPLSNECSSGSRVDHVNPHMAAMSGMPSNQPAYHSVPPPWRGADVMNGLLSLDITFEGPEHGGLGSTEFSAKLVQDACNETGLPPESTPAVQVLMIIKEMLAQRRLNEPFSGGLSSYAILLLVAAVVKERRIIRKEIERVEKQRQAVQSSAVNDGVTGDSRTNQDGKKVVWPAEKQSKKVPAVSSWASVAMKPTSNQAQDGVHDNDVDDISSKKTNETIQKGSKQDYVSTSKSVQNDSQATEPPQDSTLFPQGSNDVLEVLCSGEPTAGKLLMHFLLFYGRHFDPNSICIDVSGTHHPDYKTRKDSITNSNLLLSPFTTRKAGGTYNPVTDVYTVDPIIVYDPLEGAETNNVARSCYAWSNIQWAFGQCYNTLSGVVELGAGSNSDTIRCRSKTWPMQDSVGVPVDVADSSTPLDDLSPLLELLLSF